jgi:hypothetical protein
MSTLLQGAILSDIVRLRITSGVLNSPDDQIRHWAVFRGERKRKPKTLNVERLQFRAEFDRVLREAVQSDQTFDLIKGQFAVESQLSTDFDNFLNRQHANNGAAFVGTRTARIGFILDYARLSPAEYFHANHDNYSSVTNEIPWQLAGCNFSKDNVLVWMHDFQPFTTLADTNSDLSHPHSFATLASHKSLISSSNLGIGLLCGPSG